MKMVTHIFAAEIVTCISAAETSNGIIATETVTCIIVKEKFANITVTESTTCIITAEPQNLHIVKDITGIIAIESVVSCIVPTKTATCRIDCRNFHLQKWC